jgi:branched-chain amino acid transport system permease protein
MEQHVNLSDLFDHIAGNTIDGLTTGAIYALVALGYTLVYGVLRLINFAHSEIFMVGAWTVLGIYTAMSVSGSSPLPLILLALLVAGLAAAAASGSTALVIERIAYRPLRKKNAPPLIFLITAIGCSLALMEVFGYVLKVLFGPPFGRAVVGVPTLVSQKPLIEVKNNWLSDIVGEFSITNLQVIVVVAALVMMYGLDRFVNHTRPGRAVRAVAQDPDTAALMGVNKDRVIMLIFLLAGTMAGVAALLYTMRFSIVAFDMGFLVGLKAFTAAVLGGIGNLRGALVGGLLLGIVEVYASSLLTSNWKDVVAFIVLVVVLMFRPTGILGESLGRARA